ncbi:glucokinase [Thiovibrio sp. JS02]
MGFFLAGDLGGTKTILALYQMHAGRHVLLREQRFASGEHADLGGMVAEFLKGCPQSPVLVSFGVAGPVVAGKASITNLGWTVDSAQLKARFGFAEVLLLNDLVAAARAVPFLKSEDLFVVNAGEAVTNATLAVLAPGTGLGEAYLCWDGERYRAYPSEGGHADFAPLTAQQQELLSFLRERFGHVSYETVCSGLGIPHLYQFLVEADGRRVSPQLEEELAGAADRTPVLLRHALEHDCPVCLETLRLFFAVLAAETGNAALRFLATGGIFLGGGILPRLLPVFDRQAFMAVFVGKGRMADILRRIPVRIITRENTTLLGAALAASQRMAQEENQCR